MDWVISTAGKDETTMEHGGEAGVRPEGATDLDLRPNDGALDSLRVLLVDDDPLAQSLLLSIFRRYAPTWQLCWEDSIDGGIAAALTSSHDAAIVDVSVASPRDGIQLVRHLRDQGSNLPILMLSGDDCFDVRTLALAAGADDYLGKVELNDRDLVTRTRVVIWRRGPDGRIAQLAEPSRPYHLQHHLAAGAILVDLTAEAVFLDGQHVPRIRGVSYRLLVALIQVAGQLVPWRDIEIGVFKGRVSPSARKTAAYRLRNHLGRYGPCLIGGANAVGFLPHAGRSQKM
jgi:DNA-binding response OmpR family regulator